MKRYCKMGNPKLTKYASGAELSSIYSLSGNILGNAIDNSNTNANYNLDSNPYNNSGRMITSNAFRYAGQGAAIGSTINPVLGTAIGAGVGAIGGAVFGAVQNNKLSKEYETWKKNTLKGNINQGVNNYQGDLAMGFNPKGNRYATYPEGGELGVPNLTKLTDAQEIAYNKWLKDNKIIETKDYDMRGYWKETGFKGLPHTGHFPDTYKLLDANPFGNTEGDNYFYLSDESKYASKFDRRNQGFWDNKGNFVKYAKGGEIKSMKDLNKSTEKEIVFTSSKTNSQFDKLADKYTPTNNILSKANTATYSPLIEPPKIKEVVKPKVLPKPISTNTTVSKNININNPFINSSDSSEVMTRQVNDFKKYGKFVLQGKDVLNRTDYNRNNDSKKYISDNIQQGDVIIDIGSGLGNRNAKLAGISVKELYDNPNIKSKAAAIIATDIPSEIKSFEANKNRYNIDYATVSDKNFNTDIVGILKNKNLQNSKNIILRSANSLDLIMNKENTLAHFNHLATTLKDKKVIYIFNNKVLTKNAGSDKWQITGDINNRAFDHRQSSWKVDNKKPSYTNRNNYMVKFASGGKLSRYISGGFTPQYEVEKDEVVQGNNVNLTNGKQISKDMHLATDYTHNDKNPDTGGTGVYGSGGNRVFSNRSTPSEMLLDSLKALKIPVKKNDTHANIVLTIAKNEAKFEKGLDAVNFRERNTAKIMLERYNNAKELVFLDQELQKGNVPQQATQQYAKGGKLPKYFEGTGNPNSKIKIASWETNDPMTSGFNWENKNNRYININYQQPPVYTPITIDPNEVDNGMNELNSMTNTNYKETPIQVALKSTPQIKSTFNPQVLTPDVTDKYKAKIQDSEFGFQGSNRYLKDNWGTIANTMNLANNLIAVNKIKPFTNPKYPVAPRLQYNTNLPYNIYENARAAKSALINMNRFNPNSSNRYAINANLMDANNKAFMEDNMRRGEFNNQVAMSRNAVDNQRIAIDNQIAENRLNLENEKIMQRNNAVNVWATGEMQNKFAKDQLDLGRERTKMEFMGRYGNVGGRYFRQYTDAQLDELEKTFANNPVMLEQLDAERNYRSKK